MAGMLFCSGFGRFRVITCGNVTGKGGGCLSKGKLEDAGEAAAPGGDGSGDGVGVIGGFISSLTFEDDEDSWRRPRKRKRVGETEVRPSRLAREDRKSDCCCSDDEDACTSSDGMVVVDSPFSCTTASTIVAVL